MIKRFYVDNYKCLVNFTYEPKPFELIIGGNGSGKTTVFEALDKVRRFIAGEKRIEELFSPSFKTKWQTAPEQVFELDLELAHETLNYRLVLTEKFGEMMVLEENLSVNGNPLLRSALANVTTYQDSSDLFREVTALVGKELRTFPLSVARQTALLLAPGGLLQFALRKLHLLRLDPAQMEFQTDKAQSNPTSNFSNYASYYAHHLQEDQGLAFDLTAALREVFSGFDSFTLKSSSKDTRELSMVMNEPAKGLLFRFDELSDGQRALVALYTLLFFTLDREVMLWIDEPENYVALREIQPWLIELEQKVKAENAQVILISHHPELINLLTDRGCCIRFFRENNGHTRIEEFNPYSELTAAEIVARGWEDDE